jgi:hypothetical protein
MVNLIGKIGNAFRKVGSTLNPMEHLINNKKGKKVMKSTGQLTNDYLLPSTVQLGKPIYDATAMASSTLLTGNPIAGKVMADTLWKNMVERKNADLRKNQQSKSLGLASEVAGKVISKQIGKGYKLYSNKTNNNKWIQHVKQIQQQHKCSYKDALKLASKSYKK